ncbi:Mlo-related protein [Dillenia turbinata]|uniref:MLO-like protein n=1 Tax=Dillenia turbinata TaxID=194707 RepID=A0AAN8V6B7_9MAGN
MEMGLLVSWCLTCDNCCLGYLREKYHLYQKMPFTSSISSSLCWHFFMCSIAFSPWSWGQLSTVCGYVMRKWKAWEEETKTREYEFSNDPERFRFARDTTFGRRHLHSWAQSPILLWLVCFFRQFVTSITKVDYFTLRHGFITIILLVGAKLQMIITKLGLRIEDRGGVVKGTPVVQPGDDLFWFNKPRLILYLIHFVLFQNAFQLAFFSYSWYEFGFHNCFHRTTQDVVIRLVMGAVIQFICSYVTLPLYALVTQMGSTMRTSIFNERVATALKNWRHTAKKRAKHSQHSASVTPFSSRPATPSRGMSPVHLLHNYPKEVDSNSASPSRFEVDHWVREESPSPSPSPPHHDFMDSEDYKQQFYVSQDIVDETQAPLPPLPPRSGPTQHEIDMSNFSFGTR